jgi:nitroreductase
MQVRDAIQAKRAIRSFAPRPLAQADLDAILEAGRRAHSAKNRQRWDFVVVRDRERLQALSTAGPTCGHVAGAAAAVALLTPDPLVAWELGVGSCPATVYEPALVRGILGYPEDMHCEFMLSFGYPADPGDLVRANRPGGRRPTDDIVHQETWAGDAG